MRFRACYAIKNENMRYLQLGGGTPEGRVLVWHYGVNANISLLLQAIEHLSAHPKYLRFGLLCKYFW